MGRDALDEYRLQALGDDIDYLKVRQLDSVMTVWRVRISSRNNEE